LPADDSGKKGKGNGKFALKKKGAVRGKYEEGSGAINPTATKTKNVSSKREKKRAPLLQKGLTKAGGRRKKRRALNHSLQDGSQ